MTLVVQKFGGSSLADLSRVGRVADLVASARARGEKLIVVVSAMGKTTEALLAQAREAAEPKGALAPNFGELPRRELDMLVSSGERVSMALLSIALHARGVRAVSLTGSQAGIVTSTSHFDARIQEVRPERILGELARNDVVVVAGYQGVSQAREITTLGRGGSDTTAVALAATFQASRCEIYSDVDGVYTADPNRVARARHLPVLDYATLQEMTCAGARVLNARAVGFGKAHGVRIHARRTEDFASGKRGRETCVLSDQTPSVRAVVANRALAVVSAPLGAREQLLETMSQLLLDVRDVLQRDDEVHATLPLASLPDFATARKALLQSGLRGLRVSDGYAELSAIGPNLEWSSKTAREALEALGEKPLLCIERPRRLSTIVRPGELDEAERLWHELFVEAA
jgi:aspartate kinase